MADILDRCVGSTWQQVRDEGDLAELLAAFDGSISTMCAFMGWSRTGRLRRVCAKVLDAEDTRYCVEPHELAEGVTCLNREIEDPELIGKLWQAAKVTREATVAANTEQDEAAFEVDGRLPIGIWNLGDAHIGAEGVNYFDLQSLFDTLAEEPGLYGVINGDMIDGFVANSPDNGRFSQVLRPRFQKRLAKHLCEKLGRKMLAMTLGQHEFFSGRLDDFDFAAYLAMHGNAVYLGPGGKLTLRFRETGTEYSIGVWHKYSGSSVYDNSAGAKKLFREHGPFDVTVVADKHSPAASIEVRQGETRAFLRGGTFKLRDDYSKSLGYTDARVSVPLVIIWPDEKEFWVTLDVDRGLDYLRACREVAARELACREAA